MDLLKASVTAAESDTGPYTLVELSGEADVTNSEALREVLDAEIAREPRTVVIDLGGLRFMDSSALHVILRAMRAMDRQGGVLVLARPTETVARMLHLTATDQLIPVYRSVGEAVSGLGGVWGRFVADKINGKRCLRRRHIPRRHGVSARAAAFSLPGPGGRTVTVLSGEEAPMRIALIAAGADAASAEEQCGLARALRDAGQQVAEHVMVGGGGEVQAAVPGFADGLRSLWSRERPDVVHALGWAAGLASLAAARDAGVPVVTAFGSLATAERRHGLMPQLERTRLERAIGRSSGAVISPCSEQAADLVRMGVSRPRVHVIPAGLDLGEFTPDGPAAGRTAGRGAGPAKPRIVTVAGRDDDQAATLARAVGAVPGAELIACPADGDLAAVLRSADVFVDVPAHAPRGVPVLRAMACGVPVIASAVGAHVDMVVEGTTGLLVPPGRPELLAARIRHLLGHPMLRQACSVAAVDRARSRYSWDRVAAETLAVYEGATEAELAAA